MIEIPVTFAAESAVAIAVEDATEDDRMVAQAERLAYADAEAEAGYALA